LSKDETTKERHPPGNHFLSLLIRFRLSFREFGIRGSIESNSLSAVNTIWFVSLVATAKNIVIFAIKKSARSTDFVPLQPEITRRLEFGTRCDKYDRPPFRPATKEDEAHTVHSQKRQAGSFFHS